MRIKNLYECDENCRKCTYEHRNPTGFSIMDECSTDNCPHGNYKIGNVDKLGGRHTEGHGWNPLGEYCKECKHTTCEECIKWSNRDKKLRNNIPPQLKTPTPSNKSKPITKPTDPPTNQTEQQPIQQPVVQTSIPEKPIDVNAEIIAKVKEIMSADKPKTEVISVLDNLNETNAPTQNFTTVSKPQYKPLSAFDDFDIFDETPKKSNNKALEVDISDIGTDIGITTTEVKEEISKNEVEEKAIDDKPETHTTEDDVSEIPEDNNINFDDEINFNEISDNDDSDIDFGIDGFEDTSTEMSFGNYDEMQFDDDDDDIPMPEEYIEDAEIFKNAEKELYATDDEDDEDFDEDDDAEFELYEQTKKLKHSILFAPETKIARYQVRDKGVYLSVEGNAKVTVKGRNDSDGFSYCDATRFPRYVREGILNGELYENPNIKITDETCFKFIYFTDIDGEITEKESRTYIPSIENATEDKIRRILKKAFDET